MKPTGLTLPELVVVMAITGALLALGVPRLASALDRVRVARAATEVTTALAVARHGAVAWGVRSRLLIASDSLRIDTLGRVAWGAFRRLPGPAEHGVTLDVSNEVVQFGPSGIGWGVSNTRITLHRGVHSETITTSRLGRVKRW